MLTQLATKLDVPSHLLVHAQSALDRLALLPPPSSSSVNSIAFPVAVLHVLATQHGLPFDQRLALRLSATTRPVYLSTLTYVRTRIIVPSTPSTSTVHRNSTLLRQLIIQFNVPHKFAASVQDVLDLVRNRWEPTLTPSQRSHFDWTRSEPVFVGATLLACCRALRACLFCWA
jgi:hypothetical protein